jgi:hypothetical protein
VVDTCLELISNFSAPRSVPILKQAKAEYEKLW